MYFPPVLTITFVVLALVVVFTAATDSAADDYRSDPKFMAQYYEIRNKCEWKAYDGTSENCGAKTFECQIDAVLPEGKGFFQIIRSGPFTTSGGELDYGCHLEGKAPDSKAGTWITRTVAGAVDPFTGIFLPFPPILISKTNSSTVSDAYIPESLPKDVYKQMPWLMDSISGTRMASQCTREGGGTDCFAKTLPRGYGQKRFKSDGSTHYDYELMDVRDMGGPPIQSTMEFAEFHLVTPDREVGAPRSVLAAQLAVGSELTRNYNLKYNTNMYQFVTYFVPTRMMFVGATVNFQGRAGDELWVVRGTQSDLGIPANLQRPVIYKRSTDRDEMQAPWAVGAPIQIDKGDSIPSLMNRMEDALKKSAAEFAHKNAGKSRVEANKASQGSVTSSYSSSSSPSVLYDFMQKYDSLVPPSSPAQPEILCRHAGSAENLSNADFEADVTMLKKAMSDRGISYGTQRRLGDITDSQARSFTNIEHILANDTQSSFGSRSLRGWESRSRRGQRGNIDGGIESHLAEDTEEEGQKTRGEGDEFVVLEQAGQQSAMHRRAAAWSPYVKHASVNYDMVDPKMQVFGFPKYTLPGEYFRAPVSSDWVTSTSTGGTTGGTAGSKQCNSFKVDAGEYITLVHFSYPRTNLPRAMRDSTFDPYEFLHHQDTMLEAYVYMPDTPWFK